MYQTGLVSISFRNLSPAAIIEAVKQAGLDGIEWGGDVHVPAGNTDIARQVRKLTTNAGLEVFAYGSYYRVGCSEDIQSEFSKVLDCAKELDAPIIRIWAYNKGSADVSEQEFERLVQESRFIAKMASEYDIKLSFECHGGTYTDDYHAALHLIKEIDCENITMLWQPNQLRNEVYNLEAAKALATVTTNIHTFHWDDKHRYPLADGKQIWAKYISCFHESAHPHVFLLEFMHDDAIESLLDSARVLQFLLKERVTMNLNYDVKLVK